MAGSTLSTRPSSRTNEAFRRGQGTGRRARGRLGGAPRDRRRARARSRTSIWRAGSSPRAPSLSRGGACGGAQPARRVGRAGRRTRPLLEGAPVPVFKPSQRGEMLDALARHTRIEAYADGCTGFTHCHHEKVIVIDGRVAFVGGIDLTLDGGDRGTRRRMSHEAESGGTMRPSGSRVSRRGCGPALPSPLARDDALLPRGPRCLTRPATSRLRSSGRRRTSTAQCATVITRSSRRIRLRFARPSASSTSRASSSGHPRSSRSSRTSWRIRRPTTFASSSCYRPCERRRRHLARPGRCAHSRRGRDDPVLALHDLRTRTKSARPRVRALEDRASSTTAGSRWARRT